MFLQCVLWRIVFALSPHTMSFVLTPAGFSSNRALMYFAIPECIPPHNPLSDEMANIKWFGLLSSELNSAFSNKAEKYSVNNAYFKQTKWIIKTIVILFKYFDVLIIDYPFGKHLLTMFTIKILKEYLRAVVLVYLPLYLNLVLFTW